MRVSPPRSPGQRCRGGWEQLGASADGAVGRPVPRGHPLPLLRLGLELPLLPVFSLQTRQQQRTSH
ncbi:hypothetical protein PAL_GLEAN10002266 [Pteropus alecto]|uniref:Uncharacterized protein n=1 Tax=Pteropus alecto TaxID=9402 RepID=L5KPA8_PTEAL|nr:hypothetical protein PAL_GLEAN10002266 [Pteropus alecto]